MKLEFCCPDIRNQYAGGSWETFNALLDNTPPLNGMCRAVSVQIHTVWVQDRFFIISSTLNAVQSFQDLAQA
jgi:hypothetical protein